MKTQIDEAIDNYLTSQESNTADAEWGFLKNIVNIDRFFDSGVKAWETLVGLNRVDWYENVSILITDNSKYKVQPEK